MSSSTDRGGGDLRYLLRFCVTALLLVSATLVLVLVVLPQRYVLSADSFRESVRHVPDAGVPFDPLDAVRIAAVPVTETPPTVVVAPGPAQVLWDRVLPLLRAGRHADALPIFEAYLRENPGDDDARRELASTLVAAGRGDEGAAVLADILERRDDPALRLLLARTLRDAGREEASEHYRHLLAATPGDVGLAVEWARALAAFGRRDEAVSVLRDARASRPGSIPLRVELARTLYFYFADGLAEAEALLSTLSPRELRVAGAAELLDNVRAALAVPEPPPAERPPPPTLPERVVLARDADDFGRARTLLEEALAADATDVEAWLAYANLLEYELADYAGALEALREVEGLAPADARLRFRIALLETWSGSPDRALAELGSLLADLESGALPAGPAAEDGGAPVTSAEVRALMGDLHRWEGRRLDAVEQYRLALDEDPDNGRALDGLNAVRAAVAILIEEVEVPGLATHASGLADTDDFGRFDVGGDWTRVRDEWTWSGSVGQRWLSGLGAPGAPRDLGGAYVRVTPARWWRWGTIRTAASAGAQWVRDGQADLTFGAAVQYRPTSGTTLSLEYAHEPAYPLTATLQSVAADVSQDRFLATLGHALSDRWSATFQADVAVLDADDVAGSEASTRLQGAASVSRSVSRTWSVGWSAVAMRYTRAAPAPGGLRLFWDPRAALSTGPSLSARAPLSPGWAGSLRLGPGVSLVDERGGGGLEAVPSLSADAGLVYEGSRTRTAIDVFYAQSRLEGYRTYGLRLSLSTNSLLSGGPDR